jgi:ATP-dependent Clp protease ATP-binding subunit ClpX
VRQLYCGFCGKHQQEVERLIDGPTVAICNECIVLMHGMLDSPSNREPTSLDEFRKKRVERDLP